MTKDKLIKRLRTEYLKAKEPIISSRKIIRGTSHSISSYAEDIFAKFIADQFKQKFKILIDPQISIPSLQNSSGNKIFLFRPDICVICTQTNCIKMIFDLKMDLGYRRNNFIDFVESRNYELKKIKNHKASCSLIPNQDIFFSENLIWNYIIISSGNISQTQMNIIVDYFSKNKMANFYILVEGHLNDFKNNNFTINDQHFNNLTNEINNNFTINDQHFNNLTNEINNNSL